ncbi:multidrug resistance-associated 1 [Brachionus plicatilis]|uniref:ABC-type glutathione-S-conjugate transporter n=1 Tax=Brachionus plicatilis TaxID=10195 RepID=A0A3M7SLP0_BRAPC|nr:multidrug resistance-associated 1 [Brachionus plicatilis]
MFDKAIESLCGSPLWDNETIYSEYPDFTECFQRTYLIWAPCIVLWLVAPLWFYMLTRQRTEKLTISWLFITKNITICCILLVEIYHLIFNLTNHSEPIFFVSPTLLAMSYILSLALVHFERIRGLRSSTLQFVFWGLLALTNLITVRSKILKYYLKATDLNLTEIIIFNLFYILVWSNLILTLFSQSNKKNFPVDDVTGQKILPENYVSLLSRLSFWWINNLILTGYKRDLTREDLWKIDDTESSFHLTNKLEIAWNKASKKYIRELNNKADETIRSGNKSYGNGTVDEEQKLTETPQVKIKGEKKVKKPSFTLCLCRVYAGKFLAGSFIKLIQDILLFVGPVILDKLLNFIKDKDQNVTVGFFYTALLFLSAFIQSFVLQHYFHRMFIVGSRIKTSTTNLVYKKSLRLLTSARKSTTVGEMTNLIAVNAQMIGDLTTYLNIIWSAPFQITVAMYMLWQYLGVAAIIGVSTILIFIPLNIVIGNMTKKIQLTKLKQQDSRIKMMNEILSGIKILKFYGWELSFKDIVGSIRSKELKYLKQMGLLSISSSFLFVCAPLVITVVSFGAFLVLNDSDKFTANVVFVSLSLFNILRFPLTVLPGIISALISAKVSLTRISAFLLKEEIDESDISNIDTPGIAIKTENVDLGWDLSPLFKDLNLEIKKGKLIAVVGSVGSGKSSLLSGLLGEMNKLNDGKININGQTAYVPQQAWIQNETVKNNILFGSPYDEKFYNQVLKSCAMLTDLKIMPAGDSTEIGEKGINLSGGQKQRISLARSVYSNADIYMLDDPLSAVDSHVGKHIFDQVIGPKGFLKDKTRIFVTNSLGFLPQVDEIIVLENGMIVEQGQFEDLKSRNGSFYHFIQSHLNDKVAEEKIEEEIILDDNLDSVVPKSPESKIPSQSVRSLNKEKKVGEKLTVKEKIETGTVKLSVLKEYIRVCRIPRLVGFMALFCLSNIASVGSNVYLSYWSNNAENSEKLSQFTIFASIGLTQNVLTICADILYLHMTYSAAKSLHNVMLFSILRSTMEFFESTPSGRIINRFSKDIDAAERAIPESLKSLCRCLFHVLFTVLVIASSTPLFLVSLIPIIIIYIFAQRYFVASMRQLKRMESASKSPIFSHFSETLTGVTTIRAYNSQNRFIKIMQNHVDENLLFFFPNNISNRWLALRLELIGNLITVFASFFAVLARNSISSGLVGLSITYSLNVSQTLNWLVRMSADFETNITSVERIKEYCETPHEAEYQIEETKPSANWPQNGEVKFENYSVKYREVLDNVLKNINLVINPAEKIGIVGRTGAGKSSLTLSLFRILENSTGTILIDDVNIKKIGLHDLRHKLTIIPQDPIIFSGTIRMNLDPFGEKKDDDLWKALDLAGLKDFVYGLENKLDYECAEGGENFSVGQRQLICLARALLRKTKILILDEATASIDHQTDKQIQITIRKEFVDCTVLTIAHRLNTIMDSSRIMVLDQGKIVEFDSPQSLLKNKNGFFYLMAKDAGLV